MQSGTCEGSHKPTHVHFTVAILNSIQELAGLHVEGQLVHDQIVVTPFDGRDYDREDHTLGAHVANSDQNINHRVMSLRHIDRIVIRGPRHQRLQHLHPRHHFRVRLRQGLLRPLSLLLQTCQISFLTS